MDTETDARPGIRERLRRLIDEAPEDAPAIEFDQRWWTWGDLQRCATAVERALSAAGSGPGTRVGIVLENRPEHVATVAAVLATGRCVVTLSPLQPPARLAADVERSRLPVVVASPEVLERSQAGDAGGLLEAATATGVALSLAADGSPTPVRDANSSTAEEGAAPPESAGTAVEMLTSGTTGPPKRVHLSTDQLDRSLRSAGHVPGDDRLLSGSAALVSTPLVHIGGLWAALVSLSAGRRMILTPRFTLESWVDAVERHGLRAAGLVPAAMRTVLDAEVDPARLSTLEVVTSGTAPCPPELADAFFRRYGTRVLMTYGATEFAGAVAGWTKPLHKQWWDTKAGSAGRAFPGSALRVVDEQGGEVAIGEVGHLEVHSAQSGGRGTDWVRTSDLARLDADGFLWIAGRADDAIVRGGFKVAPDTVRAVLENHRAVREAAVAGLPDQRLGAVPVAAVELEPAERATDPEALATELTALCRTHLTPYEVPTHVLVVDALPRTPSSKVSKVELLEAVREDLQRTGAPRPEGSPA
jgi:acyl-coenzyme A synthetase/AMP-(fatty) acid ligase